MSRASILFIALLFGAHASIAAEKKPEKTEWVKRCDRLKEDRRIACLDEVRAEAQKRFFEKEAVQPEASQKPPAKTDGKS